MTRGRAPSDGAGGSRWSASASPGGDATTAPVEFVGQRLGAASQRRHPAATGLRASQPTVLVAIAAGSGPRPVWRTAPRPDPGRGASSVPAVCETLHGRTDRNRDYSHVLDGSDGAGAAGPGGRAH